MKVLWFANTPCGALEKLTGQKTLGGGWLISLANSLAETNKIELHIAFYWHEVVENFVIDGITYHPIFRYKANGKLKKILAVFEHCNYGKKESTEIERCINVVNELNPDLIHIHGSEENFGLISKEIHDIPIVLSIQGLLSPYYYKLYSGYKMQDIKKNDKLIYRLLGIGYSDIGREMRMKATREKEMFTHITNIIGRTSWDRDCSLSLNPNRKYFICNEILRPEFFNAQWQKPIDSKLVLTTTVSNGLYKGLEVVYETANILFSKSVDFEWNVIGVSSGDFVERLTRFSTCIQTNNVRINLLGRKNAGEMIEIFNQSNIFVQVSHIENSSNSLCEAMILGMPIIASYAGGTNSMLEDGKEGVLVQDGDPYRLAGSIINMQRNYSKAIEMGKMARRRALLRHNPESVTNELLIIYNNVSSE